MVMKGACAKPPQNSARASDVVINWELTGRLDEP